MIRVRGHWIASWSPLVAAVLAAGPVVADEGFWTFDNLPLARLASDHQFKPDAIWIERLRKSSVRLALRLTPKDHAKIRAVGLEVIAELDGPDRIQARTRRRLESLDEHLRDWGKKQRAASDIRVLHSRMSDVCTKLPSDDSGRSACQKFLANEA